MTCNGCGNIKAFKTVTNAGFEYCDRCGEMPKMGLPDVYWDGTAEHGLADDPRTGQPVTFASRAQKARYLKERNLFEAGDKVHGAPASSVSRGMGQDNSGEVVARALKHVREMGADRRRQEYQRILNQSGR